MRSTLLHWNPLLFSFLLTTFILLSASAAVEDDDSSEDHHSEPEVVSLELVHRHDPRIPGNENLKLDRHEAIRDRVLMDMTRKGLTSMIQMPMRPGWGYEMPEYFVHVTVGTPPQNFWLMADTGSDLMWINCNDKIDNIVDIVGPTRISGTRGFCRRVSSTYNPILCSDPKCKTDFEFFNGGEACGSRLDNCCTYSVLYAHGTTVYGDLGTDVVTLGTKREKKGTIENMVVGCNQGIDFGFDNESSLFHRMDGFLGLAYTPISFMYRATKQYGNKFSYCLMDSQLPKNRSNFLTFGSYETKESEKATLTGPMSRTKLFVTEEGEYSVQMEGISLGGQMLQIPSEVWDFKNGGRIIIDSGSTLTTVGKAAFKMVGQTLMKAMAPKYKEVLGNKTVLRYCFVAGEKDGFEKHVPQLAFHFAGGAVFKPPVRNYIVDLEPNLQCLALDKAGYRGIPSHGILGNFMQQFHLWEFDLAAMTVGFAPSQCILS